MTTEELFWLKVDKSPNETDCWLWTAGRFSNGYGCCTIDGKNTTAHRYSLFLVTGVWSSRLNPACHSPQCPNRHCVNPNHLRLDSQKNNVRDSIIAGTHYSVVQGTKDFCQIDSCDKFQHAHSRCQKHYDAWKWQIDHYGSLIHRPDLELELGTSNG